MHIGAGVVSVSRDSTPCDAPWDRLSPVTGSGAARVCATSSRRPRSDLGGGHARPLTDPAPTAGRGPLRQRASPESSSPLVGGFSGTGAARGAGHGTPSPGGTAARNPHFPEAQTEAATVPTGLSKSARDGRRSAPRFHRGEFRPFRGQRKRRGNPARNMDRARSGRESRSAPGRLPVPGRGRAELCPRPRRAPAPPHEAPSRSSGPSSPAASSGPSALLQKKATSLDARRSMAPPPPLPRCLRLPGAPARGRTAPAALNQCANRARALWSLANGVSALVPVPGFL